MVRYNDSREKLWPGKLLRIRIYMGAEICTLTWMNVNNMQFTVNLSNIQPA